MISQYLLRGAQPVLSVLVGGFGHPVIQVSDAFELQSPYLAVEALAMNAIDYNDLHKFLLLSPSGANPKPTLPPSEILSKIAIDPCSHGLVTEPGVQNTTKILSKPEPKTAVL